MEDSLQRYAKRFGDTTAQAVTRWGVGTCRELALETQAYGATKTKAKQAGAIIADAYNVLLVVDSVYKSRAKPGYYTKNKGEFRYFPPYRVLESAKAVDHWIEINQTIRKSRTVKKPWIEKKVCSRKVFDKVMREKTKRAGMAKGAWIGAGNHIAKAQKGEGKFTIGQGFLKYAQKHAINGTSTIPRNGWNPVARLTNKIGYSGTNHVLKPSAFPKASAWGLRKTKNWYAHALRAIDKKTQ